MLKHPEPFEGHVFGRRPFIDRDRDKPANIPVDNTHFFCRGDVEAVLAKIA
jgi:hypothetical protein